MTFKKLNKTKKNNKKWRFYHLCTLKKIDKDDNPFTFLKSKIIFQTIRPDVTKDPTFLFKKEAVYALLPGSEVAAETAAALSAASLLFKESDSLYEDFGNLYHGAFIKAEKPNYTVFNDRETASEKRFFHKGKGRVFSHVWSN